MQHDATITADRYATHLRRRGLSLRTVRRNRDTVATFVRAIPGWRTVSTAEVERWLDRRCNRNTGTPLAARSRYWWVSTLATFYAWAVDAELCADNPAGRCVRPKLPPLAARPLRELDAALVMTVTVPGPVRVACALMLYGGLRCAEVAGLRWRDVDEVAGRLTVRGKGGRTRFVPIGPRLAGELPERGRPSGSVIGARWGPQYVSQRMARHLAAIGIAATAHQLRHTFATRLYGATSDIAVVQRALGHASVATTQIYVSVSDAAVAAGVALVG
jgi:integrase/recombinase XerD